METGASVLLERDLDFDTNESYENSERTDFGDLNNDGEIKALKEELTAETDAANEGFIPIGYSDNDVGLQFDGNNHTIANLYIKSSEYQYVGLFGEGSSIQNLTVSGNIYVSDSDLDGNTELSVGGIAGSGSCENCKNDVDISVVLNNALEHKIGGVVGSSSFVSHFSAKDSSNAGSITIENANKCLIGGISAGEVSSINGVSNTGSISVSGNENQIYGISKYTSNSGGKYSNGGTITITGNYNHIAGINSFYTISHATENLYNSGKIYIIGNNNQCGGIALDCSDNIYMGNVTNKVEIYIDSSSDSNIVGGIWDYISESVNLDIQLESIESNVLIDDKGQNSKVGTIAGAMYASNLSGADDSLIDAKISSVEIESSDKCLGEWEKNFNFEEYSETIILNHCYSSQGTCIFCGSGCEHEYHNNYWAMHVCKKCDASVDHNWDNGICTTCGYQCQHENNWDTSTGICNTCGYQCYHGYWDTSTGICNTCGYQCMHENTYEQDGYTYCSNCNQQITW